MSSVASELTAEQFESWNRRVQTALVPVLAELQSAPQIAAYAEGPINLAGRRVSGDQSYGATDGEPARTAIARWSAGVDCYAWSSSAWAHRQVGAGLFEVDLTRDGRFLLRLDCDTRWRPDEDGDYDNGWVEHTRVAECPADPAQLAELVREAGPRIRPRRWDTHPQDENREAIVELAPLDNVRQQDSHEKAEKQKTRAIFGFGGLLVIGAVGLALWLVWWVLSSIYGFVMSY